MGVERALVILIRGGWGGSEGGGGGRMKKLREEEAVRHDGRAGGWGALIKAGEKEEGRKGERHERQAA